MELDTAIRSRRSARRFSDTPVPETVIRDMLLAAQAAPSGGNGQAHVFGIVKDAARKRALAEAAGGQLWIAEAPLVFACCARLDADYRRLPPDDFGLAVNRLRWGDAFWDYLTTYPDWRAVSTLLADAVPLIPAEHMFLTATAHGLSACFIGWLDVARASDILGLPEDVRCLYLLPVGYAAEPPAPIERKSLDDITFCETYRS